MIETPDLTAPAYRDARDVFTERVVKGKLFADVGGLWRIVNERVSVAAKAGARDAVLLDVTDADSPMWDQFYDRMEQLGVSVFGGVPVDLHAAVGRIEFDVVHCSGVLYHCPDPIATLTALRRLTREHLILTSCVLKPKIGPFVPAPWTALWQVTPEQQRVLAAYWRPFVEDTAVGLTRDWPAPPDADNWEPWYWLPTVPGLIAAATAAGFRLVDDAPIWNGNAHTLLLEAV